MPPKAATRPWTAEEDRLLIEAMAKHHSFDSWKDIATVVPGRTNKACRKRWLHSLSPDIKKTGWTSEEDRKLVELQKIYRNKWATISRFIEGRTDDACSKRWREALDPKLKKDEWSPEEDAQLLDAHKRLGCVWKEVGEEMQRGSLACRNRFRLLERRGPNKEPIVDLESSSSPESPLAGSSTDFTAVQYDTELPDDYGADVYSFSGGGDFEDQASSMELASDSVPVHAPFQYTSSSLYAVLHSAQPPQPLPQAPQSQSQSQSDSQLQPQPESQLQPQPDSQPQDQFWQDFLDEFDQDPPVFGVAGFSPEAIAGFSPESIADFSLPSTDPNGYYSTPLSSPENTPFTQSLALQLELEGVAESPYLGSGSGPDALFGAEGPYSLPTPYLGSTEQSPRDEVVYPSSAGPVRTRKRVSRKKRDLVRVEDVRLSATKPVNSEIKAYACGHPSCWSHEHTQSQNCFSTSGDLAEHNKWHDAEGHMYEEKPFRCALCGFDKKWKSINGLQYHLQVSTAHFQVALSSTSTEDADSSNVNLHPCDRPGCKKAYKHYSGLTYHLKHGHPPNVPQQLSEVPESVTREREKHRKRGFL